MEQGEKIAMNNKFLKRMTVCLLVALCGCGKTTTLPESQPVSEIAANSGDLQETEPETESEIPGEDISEQIAEYARRPYVYGVVDRGILFLEEDGTLYFATDWENPKLEKVEGTYSAIAETPILPMAITEDGTIRSMLPFYVYDESDQETEAVSPDEYIYIDHFEAELLENAKNIANVYGYDLGACSYVARYTDGRVGSLNGPEDMLLFDGEAPLQVAVDVSRGAVGIRKDGTLLTNGEFDQGLEQWKDIVAVSMNSSDVVGITKDGRVRTTNDGLTHQTKDWENIVAVSVNRDIVVGLKKDGTVVAASEAVGYDEMFETMESWENIVAVVVCENGTVIGVHGDRTVEVAHVQSY